MFENPFHRAVYLTGPTASGKSAVGLALARKVGGEIIALDSMTLYRGMDIGTAKPSPEEQREIPHHLIDVLDPWETASVGQYRSWALQKVLEIEGRNRLPIFVGGTALYLKTLLRGLFDGPGADPQIRDELEAEAQSLGSPAMHARLAQLDPKIGARLHPNDERRIVRALEVIRLTGKPLSDFQTEHENLAPEGVRVFSLERPRESLYDRINRRVLDMFDAGLVDEVRRLTSSAHPLSPVTLQAVGYCEVIDLLEGKQSLAMTVNLVQTRTRQFSKRQRTWFRGLKEVRHLPIDDAPPETIADRLVRTIEANSHAGR